MFTPPTVPGGQVQTSLGNGCRLLITSPDSTSPWGLAPSMNAKQAFTAVSEIPLPGSRAARTS